MTFDELVSTTMQRLNLTSDDAETRIGVFINQKYKEVTTSIGLITSRRVTSSITVDPTDTVTFPDLPQLTIGFMEKVNRIYRTTDATGTVGVNVLPQLSVDELTAYPTLNGLPRNWAVYRMGAGEVTIVLDGVPTTSTFVLNIEGYDLAETLADDAEPFIPTDFHDILIEGAKTEELLKMEKANLASIAEAKFTSRLSDLKMFIAKSAFQDIAQGKNNPYQTWYRNDFMPRWTA